MSNDRLSRKRVLPINFGPLRQANGNAKITGPCGDTMEFWVKIIDDQLMDCTYTTDGCPSSVLCGSVTADMVLGYTEENAYCIGLNDVIERIPELVEEEEHCALLATNALQAAIKNFRDHNCAGEQCGDCDKSNCDSRKQTQQDDTKSTPTQSTSGTTRITNKIAVMSGKGGVGKSTVAVNLAMALSLEGKSVGLLDIDIHGPSVPVLLGLQGTRACTNPEGKLIPIKKGELSIMSVGFFLKKDDDAIIWRGPMKSGIIKQFIEDVAWGELDYLIIDCPPGTGDEALTICQLLQNPTGAVIVTTPQEVAAADVRKSINFCYETNMPIIGVVENMSGFTCPHCGGNSNIFNAEGGKKMAKQFNIPFLGCLPIATEVGLSGDSGKTFIHQHAQSKVAESFFPIVNHILDLPTK